MTSKFRALSLIALTAILALTGFGQTAMTTTTLSAAVSTTASSFKVASATGISNASQPLSTSEIGVPSGASFTLLFVDKEAMAVQSVSSTTVNVIRGWNGTQQSAHVSGAKVWVGPSYAYGNFDPAGACTATTLPYLPRIVPTTGNIWYCGNGQWTTFGTFPGRMTVGAQLVAAATITITNPIHHITGTTTVSTVTASALPATGGCITLIPDAAGYTTSSGGNIALATTLAANKALTLCYDPVQAKFYPSY